MQIKLLLLLLLSGKVVHRGCLNSRLRQKACTMQNVLDAMPVLEKFVVLIYDRTSQCQRVNDARKILFAQKGRNLENTDLLLMHFYSTPREWHTKLKIVGGCVWFLILN